MWLLRLVHPIKCRGKVDDGKVHELSFSMAWVSISRLLALWPWSGCLPFWTFASDIKLFLCDAVLDEMMYVSHPAEFLIHGTHSINGSYYYQPDIDYNFMKLFPTHTITQPLHSLYISRDLLGIQTPTSFKCSLDSVKCITCHSVSSKWRLFFRTHT